MAAQDEAKRLQLPVVGPETMMAGCINQPETKALERTLKTYGVTWRRAQSTLTDMYRNADEGTKDQGWLSGFRAARDVSCHSRQNRFA